ncbi:unnamed protein product [Owenia fusiformis]|uniref:Transforming growth factor beta regulator 1 n=1 Tax=Owenia fusiformis TaxID=6347 RepID=A0A8S4PPL3_OWEFU|nr:unnamed protein product [Owenia fusiformis]
MVFMNAAVCDEVNKMEERVTRLREERKYLLKRVVQNQSLSDVTPQMISKHASLPSPPKSQSVTMATVKMEPSDPHEMSHLTVTGESEKRILGGGGPKKKKGEGKAKSKKAMKERRKLVQPIPVDNNGIPLFPIELGNLTVYSLGEVVSDRSAFHDELNIYPVGYCSTREYASIVSIDKPCTYTCKIIDSGTHPVFEISPDDCPEKTIRANSGSDCHSALLTAINETRGCELVDTKGKGPEFFGVSHPTIQNLIQNCPGAKKCMKYGWVKFDVCNPEEGELVSATESDSSISLEALKKLPLYQKCLKEMLKPQSASAALRSLLTANKS